ncbi:MAG: hypothetical protein ACKVHO_16590, partial [Verrucomicrobiia bacterium]
MVRESWALIFATSDSLNCHESIQTDHSALTDWNQWNRCRQESQGTRRAQAGDHQRHGTRMETADRQRLRERELRAGYL